jgi:trk system potassium uptake protein TrkH
MRPVITYLSSIVRLFSIFYIPPALVAVLYGESPVPFIIGVFSCLLLSWLLRWGTAGTFETDLANISIARGLAISSLSYICISMLSTIPFLFSLKTEGLRLVIDSWFEAVSGLTTTGLTIVPDVTLLPKSILFWRSELQWIGGIGVVIVFMFLIYKLRVKEHDMRKSAMVAKSSVSIYKAILPEKLETGIRHTVKRVTAIYGLYTGLGILALWAAGLSLFEATNITFTSLSTGGFIVTREFYSSNIVLLVAASLMVVGATSFILHDQIFRARIRELFKNPEVRLFIVFMAAGTGIGLLVVPNAKVVLFQLLSALTGTGYSIYPIRYLHPLLIAILIVAMSTGAGLASTCGGLKLFRVYTLLKSVVWKARSLSLPPTAIVPFKVRGKALPEDTLLTTHIFFTAYILLIIIGVIVFMVLGLSFLDSGFQVVSALGTVGLSTAPISPVPIVGKLVLTALMLLGRLEIFPFLVLAHRLFSKH